MIKSLLFLFCSFLAGNIFSQETILLKGKIEGDSLEGTSINIVNLTRETGTVNTSSGDFEILVALDDILLFSSIQFEIQNVKITEEIMEEGSLEIVLKQNVNELKEVRLSDIGLTGNLLQDISKVKTFDQEDVGIPRAAKPPPTSLQRKRITASKAVPRMMFNVSLDGIINRFNGKIAMLEKAIENEEMAALVEHGMKAFPEKFFTEDLQIPKDQIKNFVYFCAEDPYFESLLAKDQALELTEFYQLKGKDFREERMN